MSYAAIGPSYYRVGQEDSRTHAGSPGWSVASAPGWGENPMRAGRVSLRGVRGLRGLGADAVVYTAEAKAAGNLVGQACRADWMTKNGGKPMGPSVYASVCVSAIRDAQQKVQAGLATVTDYAPAAVVAQKTMDTMAITNPSQYGAAAVAAAQANQSSAVQISPVTVANAAVADAQAKQASVAQVSPVTVANAAVVANKLDSTGTKLPYVALGIAAVVGVGLVALAMKHR